LWFSRSQRGQEPALRLNSWMLVKDAQADRIPGQPANLGELRDDGVAKVAR
jgi:hypothetical protein